MAYWWKEIAICNVLVILTHYKFSILLYFKFSYKSAFHSYACVFAFIISQRHFEALCYGCENSPFCKPSYHSTVSWWLELCSQLGCPLAKTNTKNRSTLVSRVLGSWLTVAEDHVAEIPFISQRWKYLLLLQICFELGIACLASRKPVGGVLVNSNWIHRTWT